MGRTKSRHQSQDASISISSSASGTINDAGDPFARLLAPPPDESPQARAAREKEEAAAKKRSDEIDARLAAESAAKRKNLKGEPIKVLLLGQSESGKSTTLKNFQLTYARKQWLAEKDAWRAVIQLNLVRSVNAIASAVARELELQSSSSTSASSSSFPSSSSSPLLHPEIHPELDPELGVDAETASILTAPEGQGQGQGHSQEISEEIRFPLTEEHRTLVVRLATLRSVQRNLEVKLGSGAEEEVVGGLGYDSENRAGVDPGDPGARKLGSADHPNNNPNNSGSGSVSISKTSATAAGTTGNSNPPVSFRDITNTNINTNTNSTNDSVRPSPAPALRSRKSHQEFFVRSQGWKNALQRFRPRASGRSSSSKDGLGGMNLVGGDADGADPDSLAIARAAGDMKALWRDAVVREVVRRKVKLMDCAEFFLNDIDRVSSLSYVPSDDDIIRARLRTVGVQEHIITLESGPEPNRTWIIYDVGGSRTQRAAWPSYFDDVHAIIFLAPLSCFDERLNEDPKVNRLDDSMQLWKLVCSNRLLSRTELVLFLNKVDLLERKLESGVVFGKYVKSYREGENEVGAVGKFLRGKFMEVCRHYSKEHRGLHVHFTSVIDTQATAKTLSAVQDGILRSNLRHLDLI